MEKYILVKFRMANKAWQFYLTTIEDYESGDDETVLDEEIEIARFTEEDAISVRDQLTSIIP